ncbi:hypothetical protein VKT23_016880 [Stygiomarasmius scandens]|uniref:Mid2 domain-containing protein n=1 Tax=Marasmiellus scandens TaxID=2682957 RepID=A0ABR1IXU2_9AGAR
MLSLSVSEQGLSSAMEPPDTTSGNHTVTFSPTVSQTTTDQSVSDTETSSKHFGISQNSTSVYISITQSTASLQKETNTRTDSLPSSSTSVQNFSHGTSSSKYIPIIAGSITGGFVILILILALVKLYRRHKQSLLTLRVRPFDRRKDGDVFQSEGLVYSSRNNNTATSITNAPSSYNDDATSPVESVGATGGVTAAGDLIDERGSFTSRMAVINHSHDTLGVRADKRAGPSATGNSVDISNSNHGSYSELPPYISPS